MVGEPWNNMIVKSDIYNNNNHGGGKRSRRHHHTLEMCSCPDTKSPHTGAIWLVDLPPAMKLSTLYRHDSQSFLHRDSPRRRFLFIFRFNIAETISLAENRIGVHAWAKVAVGGRHLLPPVHRFETVFSPRRARYYVMLGGMPRLPIQLRSHRQATTISRYGAVFAPPLVYQGRKTARANWVTR